MKTCKTHLTYKEYNKFQGNGFGWVTKAKSQEYKLGVIIINIFVNPTPPPPGCYRDLK